MPSMVCIQCSTSEDTVEFPTVRDYMDHQTGGHVSRPKKVLPPSPPVTPSKTEKGIKTISTPPGQVIEKPEPVVVPEPLHLEYRWIGRHAPCNSEVKTIEVDLKDKAMVIAYCLNCDKKLEQQEVVPVKLQSKKQEPAFSEMVSPKKNKP